MKRLPFIIAISLCQGLLAVGRADEAEYQPNWDSLCRHDIPEWLKDAKFGVYTHWGVYSVPAHGGPDYIRNLYEGSRTDEKGVYSYHTEKYGPLEEFGYKDFIPMFTAPKFNADEWVGLMHEAGAKFGGICLVHHDGFLLWDSKVNRWNSANMGPKRDIYGEIAAAVRKHDDMKLLATFHHGRSSVTAPARMKETDITDEMRETWDVFDPKYADFYWNEQTGTVKEFADQWKAKITEVVDNYKPDLIWFDGLRTSMRNDHPPESYVLEVFAALLQSCGCQSAGSDDLQQARGEFNFPESFGLHCYENGRDMPTDVGPWFLIDRAIAYPWSYVNDKKYRDGADYHVRSLVDLVSRGGIFLSVADSQGRRFDSVGRTGDHARDRPLAESQRRSDLRNAALEDLCRRANRHSRHEAEQQRRREGTMGLAEGVHAGRHPLHDQRRYALCDRPGLAGGWQIDRSVACQRGRSERRFGKLARSRRSAHMESVGRRARRDSADRTNRATTHLL